jgi:hypothetical protein
MLLSWGQQFRVTSRTTLPCDGYATDKPVSEPKLGNEAKSRQAVQVQLKTKLANGCNDQDATEKKCCNVGIRSMEKAVGESEIQKREGKNV